MDNVGQSVAYSTVVAGIIALFIESLLFGAFALMYGISVWILLYRNTAQGHLVRNIALFTATTVMFALALTHVALDVDIALECIVRRGGGIQAMSDAFDMFNGLSNSHGTAKFAIYVTQMLIGDGFMIYRVYVVWDRRWRVIILPALLLAAEVLLGYIVSFYGRFSGDTSYTKSCATLAVNAFFVISVVTNLLSTGLIMKRILCSDSPAQEYQPRASRLRGVKWKVFESILQSAAIYSVASISLAITSFASPTVVFPACHSVFPSVIGLAYLIIVARICLNGQPADLPRLSMLQANASCCPVLPSTVQDTERSNRMSQPIAIHVSVSTMSDCDSVRSFDQASISIGKALEAISPTAEDTPMSPMTPLVPEQA